MNLALLLCICIGICWANNVTRDEDSSGGLTETEIQANQTEYDGAPPENLLGAIAATVIPVAAQAVHALIDWIHPETVTHGIEKIQTLFGKKGSQETVDHVAKAFGESNNNLLSAQLVAEIENAQTNFEQLQALRQGNEQEHEKLLMFKRFVIKFMSGNAKMSVSADAMLQATYVMISVSVVLLMNSLYISGILTKYFADFKATQRAFHQRKFTTERTPAGNSVNRESGDSRYKH
jgi:hypothetical protein